jgi:hypothetical protein
MVARPQRPLDDGHRGRSARSAGTEPGPVSLGITPENWRLGELKRRGGRKKKAPIGGTGALEVEDQSCISHVAVDKDCKQRVDSENDLYLL